MIDESCLLKNINLSGICKKVDVEQSNVIDGYSLCPSAFKIYFQGHKSLMLSLMRLFTKYDKITTLDDLARHLTNRDLLFPIKCHWENYENLGNIETDFFNVFCHKDFFQDTDTNCYGFIAYPCLTLGMSDRLVGSVSSTRKDFHICISVLCLR